MQNTRNHTQFLHVITLKESGSMVAGKMRDIVGYNWLVLVLQPGRVE